MNTERGFDRLVAFSDAVVAIAITLVVLPLVDTARDRNHETVAQFLTVNVGEIAAAALSFVVIGHLWQAHHTVFDRFRGLTRGMMRANFVWLAAIVFLPLPTVLIVTTTTEDRLGVVLYIGTMVVATTALAIIAELAGHAGLDRSTEGQGSPSVMLRRHRWLPVVLMTIALVLAAAVPGVRAWALLVLLVSIPAEWMWRARGDQTSQRPSHH
jgi:uncharacterized membrane protein